jgi:hypothetical protein
MKKINIIFIVLCSLLPILSSGQGKPNYVGQWYQNISQGKSPVKADVFSRSKSDFPRTKRYNLKANINQLNSIMHTKPQLVNLVVPYGDKTYTLNLARVELTAGGFEVATDKGNSKHDTGVQYRGIVDNNPAQIASLNLTSTDKSAYFSTGEGNFVLTKEDSDYFVYNDQVMELPATIYCQTPATTFPITIETDLVSGVGCKTVNAYLECDYAFYQNKGSNVTTLTNYVIGFFNQVATLYANEDIAIQISQIFVWTSPDPYASLTTPSAILEPFRTNRGTSFNGHIAHFLTTRNIGGGISYVDALCAKAYAYGVSMVYGTYSNVPTYSWTVNVVAHEMGHTFGSPHTHSCSWNGGALDNCHAPEGTCASGPAPVNGGTIMSYCHMTSSGINFNNGFGTQPGNLIRSKLLNASCIPAGTTASPPASRSTNNITSTSATLSWAAAPSSVNYAVQYKLASASTWISAGTTSTTSFNLSGLAANTSYSWSVKADCSAYAPNVSFTTTGSAGCTAPTLLTSTNITQTGATLNWSAVSGSAGYTVQYKTTAASTWISANATTNSLSLSGLTASTGYVWQVKASCSSYSAQSGFTTSSSASCSAPTSLSSTNISQTGATLSWAAVSGATGYTVQYKTATASTWISANATTNSLPISGLTASTGYVWQVKANCSSYSAQASFTTSSSAGCSAPAQLSSTNITQTGATLSWSLVSGATGYTVQYKTAAASTWITSSTTTNAVAISGLAAGTNYVWQVKASCSSYSSQASFTTSSSTGGCTAPVNLGTTNITTNAATLAWTGPANAVSYSVRYKLVGASGWYFQNNITATSFRLTNLLSKRNYQWAITAKCSNGTTSTLSAIKYFTTL